MSNTDFIELKNLKVYQLARQLSSKAWKIYNALSFEEKKIMGDQFIRSIDSVGANIAEGYGRFHFLDKNRFYYNARASQNEAIVHWLELLFERNKIDEKVFYELKSVSNDLQIKLNNFITTTFKKAKEKQK